MRFLTALFFAQLSVATGDTFAMGDVSEVPVSKQYLFLDRALTLFKKAKRVYVRVGAFARSPSKLPKIKEIVLRGAGKVSKALTRLCGSEAIDLAIV